MELITAIRERRSIRKFKNQPVERATLQGILKDSLWAPSGMNTQPWAFLVLEGAAKDKFIEISNKAVEQLDLRMKELFGDKMRSLIRGYFKDLGGAPSVIIALTAVHEQDVYMITSYESTSAAIHNLCLLAHGAGLATCWMTGQLWVEDDILGYLTDAGFLNSLGGTAYRLAGIIPIGYADQSPPVPPRKHENIIWID